jgi:hypothetical protein
MVCGTANYWQSWAGGEDRLVPTGHLVDAVSLLPETSLALYPLGAADAPCDLMIRRALVERAGGCEEVFRGLYEDIAFHAKLYLEAGLYLSSRTWFDYRLHPDSWSWQLLTHVWEANSLAVHGSVPISPAAGLIPSGAEPQPHGAIAAGLP